MSRWETFTATAPRAWASYLINGDASGIDDDDRKAADAWIAEFCDGLQPVDCEEAGFIWRHDAHYWLPLGADCERYTFLRPIAEGGAA